MITLTHLATILSAGLVVGLLFGALSAAMTLGIALGAYIVWQGWNLARLLQWVASPRNQTLPIALGRWGIAFDRLSRFAREELQARQEMQAELGRVRAAVHRMPDSLVVLDRWNQVEWQNRPAEELLGIVGLRRPIQHFVRDPEFSAWLDQGASAALELSLPQHPGRRHVMRMFSSDQTHRLLIAHDVTEQRRLDAMRRDFVANVSHEIRTPLTVISGFVETMLDIEVDQDSRRRFLDSILQQSHTMRRLIEDLLVLAKLEHDMDLAEDGPVKVYQLLSTLVNDATALSDGRHRITLTLEGPAQVRANSMELQTAVRNLLTNAVRYTPEGGEIEVNWSQHGNEGLISVRDSGIGIGAEHLPRLTERFYRVDRSRSRDSGGTGLGLAIVKHALQRHQASLEISSRLGAGSTFTIRWPASRMIKEATSPPQAQTQENN